MEIKKKSKANVIPIKKKKIKCPTCRKIASEPFVPFCSKQCADVDLMKWLSDSK